MQTLKKGSTGDLVKQVQQKLKLNADGIFGTKTEEAVKAFQKSNGLVADGIVGSKTFEKLGIKVENKTESKAVDPSVVYNPINIHISKKSNRDIKYLVIHYTAGGSSSKGSAEKVRDVFIKRSASADFAVDDCTMLQINPDLKNYYCWAVGDGYGRYGVTNTNSISIEVCSNLKPGTSHSVPNHEGWYFTEKSLDNTVKLAKILMKKYNITGNRVIRHYDASRKSCPGILGWNDGNVYDAKTGKVTGTKNTSTEWEKFKKRLM